MGYAHFLRGACGHTAERGTMRSLILREMMSDPYKPGVQHGVWHACLTEWCMNNSGGDGEDD